MSIFSSVSEQIKDAMRAREKIRLQALRNIRAAFISAQKETGAESLSDEQALVIIRRQAKQLAESIEAYDAGGRAELAEKERAELVVVQGFLPTLATESTVREWIQVAIETTGAQSKSEMGKVMGFLMKHHKSDLDGKMANRIVSELLT